MADTFSVSLTQQPAMIATVPFCTPILRIIQPIACVFGMGGNSVVARLLGKWRKENAGKILNLSTYAMRLPGLVTLGLGLACSPQLASIVGADAENMAYTCDYLLYIFLGAPFIMLSNGFAHLFRPVGLVKQNAVGLVLGNAINICGITCSFVPWDRGGWRRYGRFPRAFVLQPYCLFRILARQRRGTPCSFFPSAAYGRNARTEGSVVSIGVPGALITVLMRVANIV